MNAADPEVFVVMLKGFPLGIFASAGSTRIAVALARAEHGPDAAISIMRLEVQE